MQPLANKQKKKKFKKYLKNIVHGITHGTSRKNSYQLSQKDFPLFFLDFLIRIVKIMCPRIGQGLHINLQKTRTNSKQTTPLSSEIW